MTQRVRYAGRDKTTGERLPDQVLDQWEGDWLGREAVDMTGRPIEAGMWLARSYTSGRSANLEIREVREVRRVRATDSSPRVFLDGSRVPIEFPGRCLIIDWDPDNGRIRRRFGWAKTN